MKTKIKKCVSLLIFMITVSEYSWAQTDYSRLMPDTARVNQLLSESYDLVDPRKVNGEQVNEIMQELNARGITDPQVRQRMIDKYNPILRSINIAREAIKISEIIDYPKGKAFGLKNIGFAYYHHYAFMGENRDEAYKYWREALQVFAQIDNAKGAEELIKSIVADIELVYRSFDFQQGNVTRQIIGEQQHEYDMELNKLKLFNYGLMGISLLLMILMGRNYFKRYILLQRNNDIA